MLELTIQEKDAVSGGTVGQAIGGYIGHFIPKMVSLLVSSNVAGCYLFSLPLTFVATEAYMSYNRDLETRSFRKGVIAAYVTLAPVFGFLIYKELTASVN